jgi:hypothetical protein
MLGARPEHEGDGIMSLVRETADGLGRLIADHIKLARVEMVADAKEYGRHVGLLTVAGIFVAIGYVFAWIAAALGLARWVGAPLAFVIVAVLHLAGGAIGLGAVARRLKARSRPLDDTVSEVSRSVATLAAQVGRGAEPRPNEQGA